MSDSKLVERLREALRMHDEGVALMRQNLRRRHPGASDDRIEEHLIAWLRERPGAEQGDGDGRAVPLDVWEEDA